MPKKQRVHRTRGSGKYTESGFFCWLRGQLRKSSRGWPPIKNVKLAARVPYTGPRRLKWVYRCAICQRYFPEKEIEVDHGDASGSLKAFADLPGFCERLFCEEDKLRVLCLKCHDLRHEGE